MVDIFALALSHGLLALAAIRLLSRAELDDEGAKAKPAARMPGRRAIRLPSTGEGPDGDA